MHAYTDLVTSLSRPWMAIFYMVVTLVTGFHIEHGWHTLLQGLGVTGRRFGQIWVATRGPLVLVAVSGNVMTPLLVLLGATV